MRKMSIGKHFDERKSVSGKLYIGIQAARDSQWTSDAQNIQRRAYLVTAHRQHPKPAGAAVLAAEIVEFGTNPAQFQSLLS